MRTPEEVKQLLEFARSEGMPWIEVDGVRMPILQKHMETNPSESPQIPADASAEYSNEEVLFWSTPHFDELQALKEEKKNRLKEETI